MRIGLTGVQVGRPSVILTIQGMLETEARIGDRWAWGSARLEISQPL